MKPYLWVNRRYVLPDFAKADDAQLPACPWQCADALKVRWGGATLFSPFASQRSSL